MTRNFSKQVANEVVSGQGCNEKKLVNKYEERTAGMLYFFRSCDMRLSHYEMYTSEIISTVFTCLFVSCAPGDENESLAGSCKK